MVPGRFVLIPCLVTGATPSLPAAAEERLFSGPQPGERITPFRVVDLASDEKGKERDPVAEAKGAPTALVFIHTIERSLVPLLRVIDEYGAERKDALRTEVVFLGADRLAGEERARAAVRSLRLRSRTGLSVDGPEGPGNYGLNKDCMMTIVAAKEDKVAASFALVQPGFADAPAVIRALAAACGDPDPPSAEALLARQEEAGGGRRGKKEMQRDSGAVDLSALDLGSEAGLREAVRVLIEEVQKLRAEVADLKRTRAPGRASPEEKPAEDFPGAVPSDPKLQGLLRRAIRPDNDDAAVDRLIEEMESYVKGNPELSKQAADGWVRILHFGERYGTPHARKQGASFLERLKGG